jgi:hypothetical protein
MLIYMLYIQTGLATTVDDTADLDATAAEGIEVCGNLLALLAVHF